MRFRLSLICFNYEGSGGLKWELGIANLLLGRFHGGSNALGLGLTGEKIEKNMGLRFEQVAHLGNGI